MRYLSSEEVISIIRHWKEHRESISPVHTSVPEADTFFPVLDPEKWHIATRSGIAMDEKSGLNYEFLIYEC